MFGVRRDGQQGFGNAEEDRVDEPRVRKRQSGDLLRQREDYVEIRLHRQQLQLRVRPATWRGPLPDTWDSFDFCTSYTRWRNARTGRTLPRGRLRRRCGKYECRGRLFSAGGIRRDPTEPESRPHKCGKRRPLPAGACSWLRLKCAGGLDHIERVQQFQRADGGAYGGVGDKQIAGGGFQMRMAEEKLNGAEVHSGFQQVSGEGVSQRVRMNGFGDASVLPGLLAGHSLEIGVPGFSPGKSQFLGCSQRQ
jgi:hypothetical protein